MKPSKWINCMAPAFGPPPKYLAGFFVWSLRGSFKVLTLAGSISILTGVTEVAAVLLLGLLIDAALMSSPENPLADQIWLFSSGILFFLLSSSKGRIAKYIPKSIVFKLSDDEIISS